jgi:stage V sporulation protein D (sporulation-specific penicillin-binding protein)
MGECIVASASHGTVRKRVIFLFLLMAVAMGGLVVRLGYLQLFHSTWLAENATDQRIRDIPVEAKRGIIFDRTGKELAVSMSTESIYAIPAEIKNVQETAAKLAAILALNEEHLSKLLQRHQAFTWVKRKVDSNVARQIQALEFDGIGITQESRRYYPQEELASHILGFTGIDSQGLDGVEITFDSYLRGRPGSIRVEYDARGREIPYANHRFVPPVEGNDIYLTIDMVIQQVVERELGRVMQETQAKGATIVAMDPNTGEILALANRPDYNPNHFADYSPKLWRNIAVSNAYEPGSTFKIITSAAALSEKVVTLTDQFYDPGYIDVQGRKIHCWKNGGHGSETFEEVVENSCNVGFVNVGLRLGRDPFYTYLDKLGLGQPTGIDLPGEAKGIVIDKRQVKPINIATMAMGQGIAVTPIQLLTAVSAVVNGGTWLRPQIVKTIQDKNGQTIRSFQPDVVQEAINSETSNQVRGILEKVVEIGTGKNAFIDGFKIGGKTGTAQKVGAGGYLPDKYVASFIGFAPSDHPKIVMLVIVDEPVGIYYGSQVAAPVFAAAMKDVLPYLQVTNVPTKTAENVQSHVLVPNLLNESVSDATKNLQAAGLAARIEETGERVADQIPRPGSRVPVGSQVLLYTLTAHSGTGEVTVPDCSGRSEKEVMELLGQLGLTYKPANQGTQAVKQDPPAGSQVSSGTTIEVYFE